MVDIVVIEFVSEDDWEMLEFNVEFFEEYLLIWVGNF